MHLNLGTILEISAKTRPNHIALRLHQVALTYAQLGEWAARRRARAALLALDDAALKDIGISRAQALYEFDHPRWRQ